MGPDCALRDVRVAERPSKRGLGEYNGGGGSDAGGAFLVH